MKFKTDDWAERIKGLDEVQELLNKYRESGDKGSLDLAIWRLWRFAEYAMNAGLELIGERVDRGHQLSRSAEELSARHILTGIYQKELRQLESFRKKVDYGSYSREKSTHYNANNVEVLLQKIQELREELESALRTARKIP